jgi:AraC family transcriptional regulator, transcriptional activator of pobA
MESIPTYVLYGEFNDNMNADWVHCETIQSRSRLHDYKIQPHRHENLFQILHLTSGQAEIMVDGGRNTLDAPSIITLPPMAVHGYRFSADVGGTVLTLFERRLSHILEAADGVENTFRQVQIVSLEKRQDLASILATDIACIAAEFGGRALGRLGIIEARLALVFIALHRMQAMRSQSERGPGDRALHHAMRFRQLVDRDFRGHKPIEAYARKLGITSTHLNRICGQHLGGTALGIIHQRIILEAKRYLTFTSLSVKEVAIALAYDDPSYFTRFFKRKSGISPIGFRASQRNSGG